MWAHMADEMTHGNSRREYQNTVKASRSGECLKHDRTILILP